MMARRLRSLQGVLMVTTSIAAFYFYYIILLKCPDDKTNTGHIKALPPLKPQVQRHLPVLGVSNAAGNQTKKGTTADAFKGIIDESEEVLDAEGNTIPDPGLREIVKKIQTKVPKKFLLEYKNPCWLDEKNELNCLPYFYLIGMSKCGTADLWNKLTAHPDVVWLPKDPHWWGPRRRGWTGLAEHGQEVLQIREQTGDKDDSSIDWYLNWFKTFAVNGVKQSEITNTSSGQKYYSAVFGDGSISTAYSIGNSWTKTDMDALDPPYTNADLLHAIQPNAKIIVMLRNPTERARSWYYYTHPLNTPDDWHVNAMTSIECYNSCMNEHNERYCAYSFGCPYETFQGINVGLYHIYLYDWINSYTREGVLVLRLEDWHKDPVSVYRTVLDFLELRQLTPDEERKAIGARWISSSKKVAQTQTKQALDEFYHPHNRKLADLLQNDIYLYP